MFVGPKEWGQLISLGGDGCVWFTAALELARMATRFVKLIFTCTSHQPRSRKLKHPKIRGEIDVRFITQQPFCFSGLAIYITLATPNRHADS